VFTSSVSVYGRTPSPRLWPLTEEAPTNGHTVYAASKLQAEHVVRRFQSEFGLKAVILRPTLAYGPGATFMESFVRKNAAEADSRPRDDTPVPQLIHVRDLADAIVLAGCTAGLEDEVFNIGGSEMATRGELVEIVRGIWADIGWKPRLVGRPLLYSIDRAQRNLGFTPTLSYADGLKDVIEMLRLAPLDAPGGRVERRGRNAMTVGSTTTISSGRLSK
jgi:nucleoside-diphosphate-sugar epimerase